MGAHVHFFHERDARGCHGHRESANAGRSSQGIPSPLLFNSLLCLNGLIRIWSSYWVVVALAPTKNAANVSLTDIVKKFVSFQPLGQYQSGNCKSLLVFALFFKKFFRLTSFDLSYGSGQNAAESPRAPEFPRTRTKKQQ